MQTEAKRPGPPLRWLWFTFFNSALAGFAFVFITERVGPEAAVFALLLALGVMLLSGGKKTFKTVMREQDALSAQLKLPRQRWWVAMQIVLLAAAGVVISSSTYAPALAQFGPDFAASTSIGLGFATFMTLLVCQVGHARDHQPLRVLINLLALAMVLPQLWSASVPFKVLWGICLVLGVLFFALPRSRE